ncbi:MAG: gamma carbonic anhydrase family protein [Gammaproteobacteria bacterium]|nr:gamma carbonic anhydrase family protein [Gammaproteobacteria bacterium]
MIYALGEQVPQVAADAFVAASAAVIGDVHVGAGASVWFGAVLRGDVERLTIGPGTNVQDNAVLHADPGAPLEIGARVTIGHLAMLHGCHVGDDALIGIGTIVMNHAHIGARCIVGAGALVTEGKSFPDGVLIVGSPARVVRELTAEDFARVAANTQRYVERARIYRQALRPL